MILFNYALGAGVASGFFSSFLSSFFFFLANFPPPFFA